jgi:hypothetical protein
MQREEQRLLTIPENATWRIPPQKDEKPLRAFPATIDRVPERGRTATLRATIVLDKES